MTAPGPRDSRTASRRLRIALGLLLSAAFLGLAIWSLARQGVTIADVGRELATANYLGVGAYVLILFALHAVRVLRWGIMLRGLGAVPWRKLTGVCLVGQMAITLLPVRLGEAARPLLIVETGHVGVGEATATVVVERVLDGILLGLFFLGTLYFLSDVSLPPEFRVGATLTAAFFGAVALGIVVASLFRGPLNTLIERLVSPWAPGLARRLRGLVDGFFNALRVIVRQRRRGLLYFALTVLMWLATGLSLLPLFWAFGVDLPVVASFAVLCVIVLGYMIPAGPAATGTLNYAIVLALTAFQVDDAVTGALSLLIYFLLLVTNVAAGLVGLAVARLSWGAIWRRLTGSAAPPAPTRET